MLQYMRHTGILSASGASMLIRDEYARVAWRVYLRDKQQALNAARLLGL